MSERRRARRQKSFLRGFVYVDERPGALDCMIRDLSDEGARIIVSEAVVIPDVLNLHIPQKQRTLRARVQWRHGDETGLTFTAGAGAAAVDRSDASELSKRVAQLEAELAALRRLVKRLKNARAADDAAA